MNISISDLKTNPGYFIGLAQKERVVITKNGKAVARLVPAHPNKAEAAKKLIGILPGNLDYEALREERILQ